MVQWLRQADWFSWRPGPTEPSMRTTRTPANCFGNRSWRQIPRDWRPFTKPEGVSTLFSARLDVRRKVRRPRVLLGKPVGRQLRAITLSHFRKRAEDNGF